MQGYANGLCTREQGTLRTRYFANKVLREQVLRQQVPVTERVLMNDRVLTGDRVLTNNRVLMTIVRSTFRTCKLAHSRLEHN